MTKKLYYACQASGWLYHFVKKHYAPAHIPIDWTCKIHAHDLTAEGRVAKNCSQVKVKVLLEIFTQVKVNVIVWIVTWVRVKSIG